MLFKVSWILSTFKSCFFWSPVHAVVVEPASQPASQSVSSFERILKKRRDKSKDQKTGRYMAVKM